MKCSPIIEARRMRALAGIVPIVLVSACQGNCPWSPAPPGPAAVCSVEGAAADVVIAWEDDRNENDSYEIRARRMLRNGSFLGADFTVNDTSTGQQLWPQTAMAANGDFVVVWQDSRVATDQIRARGFRADGTQKFADFRVSTLASGADARYPSVSMTCAGEFVVAWQMPFGGHSGIFMRGFNADGSELFPQTRVSQSVPANTPIEHVQPAVAVSPYNGHVVISWHEGAGQRSLSEAWRGGVDSGRWASFGEQRARGFRLDATPTQTFSQIDVNTLMANGQEFDASIAINHDGRFAIAWDDLGSQIRFATFDAQGMAVQTPLVICPSSSATSQADCTRPQIALSLLGDFFVTWEDDEDGNSAYEIRAFRFGINGGAMSYPFRNQSINTNSSGNQLNPDIARHATLENHIVVWQDDSEPPTGVYEIFARGLAIASGFSEFAPQRVNSDSNGNQLRPSVAFRPTSSVSIR